MTIFYLEGLGIIPFGRFIYLIGIPTVLTSLASLVILTAIIIWNIRKRRSRSFYQTVSTIGGSITFVLLINVILVSGSFAPGSVYRFHGFSRRIDKYCSPAVVRSWSTDFIETYRDKESGHKFVDDRGTPEFLKQIHPFSVTDDRYWFNWTIHQHNKEEILSIFWGGAIAGYWGLEIGSTNHIAREHQNYYYSQWVPGIYVWHSTY